jgi:hypothetical protein
MTCQQTQMIIPKVPLPYHFILCCTTARVLTSRICLRVLAGYDLNDLYSLDPLAPNLSWTNLSRVVRGKHPSSRAYHGFVCEGHRLYVFAGQTRQSIGVGKSFGGLIAHWFYSVPYSAMVDSIMFGLLCIFFYVTALLHAYFVLQLCQT